MASFLIQSLQSPLRAVHPSRLFRRHSCSLLSIFALSPYRSFISTPSSGSEINIVTCKDAVSFASYQASASSSSARCWNILINLTSSSVGSCLQGSSRASTLHSLSKPTHALHSSPWQLSRVQSRQILTRQHGAFVQAGLSTSAITAASTDNDMSTPTELSAFPPGSERWKQWVDALGTVPHIGSEGAREILIAAPQLLAGSSEGVALRLSHLAELLAVDAGVKDTDFAVLLKAHPSMILDTSVEQAADVLDWFKRTGHFGMRELNRAARHTPEVLSYSVEELRARLQSLLTLGLESAERACLCIIHTPRLLTFDALTLASKLDILVKEFGCSRRYILQSAAHVLDRNTERLLVRAALLRHLGSDRVMIGDVYAAVSDAAFADVAVSAYLKRTEKMLPQLCSELLKLPGMSELMAQAGLDPDIGTPLQCFQAYHALWKTSNK